MERLCNGGNIANRLEIKVERIDMEEDSNTTDVYDCMIVFTKAIHRCIAFVNTIILIVI